MSNHSEHGVHGEMIWRDCPNELITVVLDAAFEVHRELGPGLLESVYEQAMALELTGLGVAFERQREVPVRYKGKACGIGFRADLLVDECLLIELKAVDELSPVHLAQTMTYLRLLGVRRGLLLNFNKRLLKDGIKRVVV